MEAALHLLGARVYQGLDKQQGIPAAVRFVGSLPPWRATPPAHGGAQAPGDAALGQEFRQGSMGVRRSYQQIANEVEAAYDVVLDEKWRGANKSRFVEMMVTDGCFLLELIRIHIVLEDSKVDTGYATNDPIFSIRNYGNFWGCMRADMIAMENQVPLIILQRLLAVQRGKSPVCTPPPP